MTIRSGPLAPRSGERVRTRGPLLLLLLLAALPAVIASCGESDDATALDLVVDPRATVDQIDIRSVTLEGQPVTLAMHLLPHQPTRLHTGDVLRLLFDDDKGGSDVVVTAVGMYQGAAVTANAIAMGTLLTKHPVRVTLVLGSGGTGGNGGNGGAGGGNGGGGGSAGSAGTAGIAGGGGSTAGGGAAGSGGVSGGGGAGRGGTTGTAGAGGTGGVSGSGGVTGAAGRGGTGGGGTGGGGRGGGAAGTGGAAGRGGTGGAGGTGGTGTAGRGGTGGTGTAGRGGSGGGTGGGGGAPRCMPADAIAQTAASEAPASVLGNITECGYTTMIGAVVKYAAVNGSHYAFLRDLEYAQSAACGRCIRVIDPTNPQRTTVATVVGSCTAIPGLCGGNVGVLLSSPAYTEVMNGASPFPVTWSYVVCPVQGVVYARLIDANYTRVVIQNHAYGIAKVELEDPAGGQMVQLVRSSDNSWGVTGFALIGRTIRVTDVNGGVVSGTLQGSNADQPLAAQFPMCIAQ